MSRISYNSNPFINCYWNACIAGARMSSFNNPVMAAAGTNMYRAISDMLGAAQVDGDMAAAVLAVAMDMKHIADTAASVANTAELATLADLAVNAAFAASEVVAAFAADKYAAAVYAAAAVDALVANDIGEKRRRDDSPTTTRGRVMRRT